MGQLDYSTLDLEARKESLKKFTHELNLSNDVDINELANMTAGFSEPDIKSVCYTVNSLNSRASSVQGSKLEINLDNFTTAITVQKKIILKRQSKDKLKEETGYSGQDDPSVNPSSQLKSGDTEVEKNTRKKSLLSGKDILLMVFMIIFTLFYSFAYTVILTMIYLLPIITLAYCFYQYQNTVISQNTLLPLGIVVAYYVILTGKLLKKPLTAILRYLLPTEAAKEYDLLLEFQRRNSRKEIRGMMKAYLRENPDKIQKTLVMGVLMESIYIVVIFVGVLPLTVGVIKFYTSGITTANLVFSAIFSILLPSVLSLLSLPLLQRYVKIYSNTSGQTSETSVKNTPY